MNGDITLATPRQCQCASKQYHCSLFLLFSMCQFAVISCR